MLHKIPRENLKLLTLIEDPAYFSFKVSGSVSVEDQACKEEYLKILKELETQHFVVPGDKLEVCMTVV